MKSNMFFQQALGLLILVPLLFVTATAAFAEKIVFLAGDDEYRSEESLPMLAAILERDFGFETTIGYSPEKHDGRRTAGHTFRPGGHRPAQVPTARP